MLLPDPPKEDMYDEELSYVILHENYEELKANEVYPVTKQNKINRTISITHNYRTYKISADKCKFRALTPRETLLFREEVIILRTHKTESTDGKHVFKLYAGKIYTVMGFIMLEDAYIIIDNIKYELIEGYYEHLETFNNRFNFTQQYDEAFNLL